MLVLAISICGSDDAVNLASISECYIIQIILMSVHSCFLSV